MRRRVCHSARSCSALIEPPTPTRTRVVRATPDQLPRLVALFDEVKNATRCKLADSFERQIQERSHDRDRGGVREHGDFFPLYRLF